MKRRGVLEGLGLIGVEAPPMDLRQLEDQRDRLGVAAAGLIAVNPLQIVYSREARPYSMLAFGATLMVLLWRRVVIGRRWVCFTAFVTAAVLSLYAHYLAGLILIA